MSLSFFLPLLSKIAQSDVDALQSDESRDSNGSDVIIIPHPPKPRKKVMITQLTNGHKLESQKFEKAKIFFIDRLELAPWVSLGFPTFFSCYQLSPLACLLGD